MKTNIIAISGKIGAGKDTLAYYIPQIYMQHRLHNDYTKHVSFYRKSFADKLKQIVQLLSGYNMTKDEHNLFFSNERYNYSQEDKNVYIESYGMTIGEMLQKLGTDAIRKHFHSDTWVNAVFVDDIRENDLWIITDCRFKNEADAVKKNGGKIIRIEGDPAGVRANSKRDLNHQSEIDLDDYTGFDLIIQNDGTEEDLINKIKTELFPLIF